MSDQSLRAALEKLREDWTLHEIVKDAIAEAEWCCEVGCGSGACEICPCCSVGYCVSGRDGLPADDPEEAGRWLEIAAEHNPAIAALRPLLLAATERDEVVAGFIDQREEYVRVLRQCVNADADYHRWQGHAEARRQLAGKLGKPAAVTAQVAGEPL